MNKPSFFSEEHPIYPILITTNVILTTLLTIFAAVATMIADKSIQGELAMSDTYSIWITTLYLLGLNTIVPSANWFANHFGFKRMYTFSVLLFTLSSFLAASSQNFLMLAIARTIQGMGAGFIFPIGLALIVQSLPKEKVVLGINLYIAGAFGGGIGLGVPLAGYFSQFSSWRMIFLLIIPFGLLTALSCWLSRSKIPEIKKVPYDFKGFFFFASFIATLLVALTLGPIASTDEGWRSPYIILLFIAALLSLIGTFIVEKNNPHSLIPISLFKDPIFTVSSAAMFLLGMATFASVGVSIQYMLDGLFYEKFVTGKIASIYGITIALISVLASTLIKIIPVPLLTFLGLSCLVFSYFLNNELSWLTGVDQVRAILLIRGIGIGLSLGPTTLMALHGIPDEFKTAAATLLTFFRQAGATYGSTLIALFSIRQTIFHTARFSEQTNTQLPAYKKTFQNLYNKFPDQVQAKIAIAKNLKIQAFIQGLNDALIAFGYMTGVVAFILMILIGYKIWQKKRISKKSYDMDNTHSSS
jgi:DHA2 family multidrug resistance protein